MFLLLLSFFFAPSFSCPNGTYVGFNKSLCYRIREGAPGKHSWYDAETQCQIYDNGHLASIPDGFTNNYITGLMDSTQNKTRFWLGGTTTITSNASWAWTDGTVFQYSSWEPGDPFNGTGYCTLLVVPYGIWGSYYCDYSSSSTAFLCEFANPDFKAPANPDFKAPANLDFKAPIKSASCPDGAFLGFNKSICYEVLEGTSKHYSWYDAETQCQTRENGHLASIPDAFTNNYLTGYLHSSQTQIRFWLGGTTTLNSNENWAWSDGSSFDYTSWKPDDPRNGTGLCTILQVPEGTWASIACFFDSSEAGFLCEFPNPNIN
uniref:C-type lectin domain-containing protein n=1 Tax=Acrobeloides nanus TaxID=290746 RepID=A0A914EIM3_9BILA